MVFILQKKPCSACLQSPEQFQAYPHRTWWQKQPWDYQRKQWPGKNNFIKDDYYTSSSSSWSTTHPSLIVFCHAAIWKLSHKNMLCSNKSFMKLFARRKEITPQRILSSCRWRLAPLEALDGNSWKTMPKGTSKALETLSYKSQDQWKKQQFTRSFEQRWPNENHPMTSIGASCHHGEGKKCHLHHCDCSQCRQE